jgi:hypothetical protein
VQNKTVWLCEVSKKAYNFKELEFLAVDFRAAGAENPGHAGAAKMNNRSGLPEAGRAPPSARPLAAAAEPENKSQAGEYAEFHAAARRLGAHPARV